MIFWSWVTSKHSISKSKKVIWMRFPASLLLKVFFCSTKSWLLCLIVKNTHLNIASQVKMHIKMYLKVHFKHRKLVKICYLCISLHKIVDIKFLSPPSLSLPALPSLGVWEDLPQWGNYRCYAQSSKGNSLTGGGHPWPTILKCFARKLITG
jgi:hypothetical protein